VVTFGDFFKFFFKKTMNLQQFFFFYQNIFSQNGEMFPQKNKNHCTQGDEFPIVF